MYFCSTRSERHMANPIKKQRNPRYININSLVIIVSKVQVRKAIRRRPIEFDPYQICFIALCNRNPYR